MSAIKYVRVELSEDGDGIRPKTDTEQWSVDPPAHSTFVCPLAPVHDIFSGQHVGSRFPTWRSHGYCPAEVPPFAEVVGYPTLVVRLWSPVFLGYLLSSAEMSSAVALSRVTSSHR